MLYRGVKLSDHELNNGEIIPCGNKKEVAILYDGGVVDEDGLFKITYNGEFNYGESEQNALVAHQIETSKYGGCFVSTTKDFFIAHAFATSDRDGGKFQGVIYWIDDKLFDKYRVVARENKEPRFPDEQEVLIRADDCGVIPQSVVVRVQKVFPD